MSRKSQRIINTILLIVLNGLIIKVLFFPPYKNYMIEKYLLEVDGILDEKYYEKTQLGMGSGRWFEWNYTYDYNGKTYRAKDSTEELLFEESNPTLFVSVYISSKYPYFSTLREPRVSVLDIIVGTFLIGFTSLLLIRWRLSMKTQEKHR